MTTTSSVTSSFIPLLSTDSRVARRAIVHLVGREKTGKALSWSTPLPTPDGWITIGEVQVGDMLFDERGQQCRVTYATPVMLGNRCFNVAFSDGTSIVADAEHSWDVEFFYGKPTRRVRRVLTTVEIAERVARLGHTASRFIRLPRVSPLQIEDTELPVNPYVLGAWLGDGNTNSPVITSADPDIMERVAQFERVVRYQQKSERAAQYGVGGQGEPGVFPYRGSCSAETRLRGLKDRLRKLGVLGFKHIPMSYLRASFTQRLALLQGLMDTDGTIGERGISGTLAEFSVNSGALAQTFRELLSTFGIKSTLRVDPARLYGKDCGLRFRVSFYPTAELPVFYLSRKLAKQHPRSLSEPKSSYRYIRSITPVESVPVRCIQVDSPSHLYLAGESMIPTHNTFWSLMTAPEPVFYISLDPNGLDIAKRVVQEHHRDIRAFSIDFKKSVEKAGISQYVQQWQAFRAAFYEAIEEGTKSGVGTLVIDTATELWEMERLATHGKVEQVIQRDYGVDYANLKALYNDLFQSPLSAIMLVKMKPEWVNDKPTGGWTADIWRNAKNYPMGTAQLWRDDGALKTWVDYGKPLFAWEEEVNGVLTRRYPFNLWVEEMNMDMGLADTHWTADLETGMTFTGLIDRIWGKATE